ncbi:MAG: hypothetical protein IT360_00520 [Gemmatimonadaceae bacterium]|nr:hypothetical protein [Gemmatimonadaceae bacterium]
MADTTPADGLHPYEPLLHETSSAESARTRDVYRELLARDDFAHGVQLAGNHSDDSESSGNIAGQRIRER